MFITSKIDNQTREKSQVLSQAIEKFSADCKTFLVVWNILRNMHLIGTFDTTLKNSVKNMMNN